MPCAVHFSLSPVPYESHASVLSEQPDVVKLRSQGSSQPALGVRHSCPPRSTVACPQPSAAQQLVPCKPRKPGHYGEVSPALCTITSGRKRLRFWILCSIHSFFCIMNLIWERQLNLEGQSPLERNTVCWGPECWWQIALPKCCFLKTHSYGRKIKQISNT